jgi:5'-nucleotidase
MRLLLSNDDGIDAVGLFTLAEALRDVGEVWVVAPDSERSAQSHALTMHKPLRVRQEGERRFAVSGTPADCVYLGLHHLLPAAPDLVVSGVNRGSNLGHDVFYSGTVAAAMEACLQGVPGVAVSLHLPDGVTPHWATAAAVAARVVRAVEKHPIPGRQLLNVNVPSVPLDQLKGVAAARLGSRSYSARVDERVDPRGRRYFWIGGDPMAFDGDPDADGPTVERGFASITPMVPDLTFGPGLAALRRWTDA